MAGASSPLAQDRTYSGAFHYIRRASHRIGETAIENTVQLAELESEILPHTLRHTAATWLMQRGADPWQAAGYLGMSLDVLLNTYGHHHPNYLSDAVEKIAKAKRRSNRSELNAESFLGR
jgi:integrase